ncbi:MAG: HAD-IC family P-type ATPase, partial [Nitrosopumilaceae archaeon]
MAKDPICGMFVEEKADSIRYAIDGREYYFCSTMCLHEFKEPEEELKKLKRQVAISALLTIPIVILSVFEIFSSTVNHFIMLALATPVQFWMGWRFYRGLWDGIKARASNMDSLIAIGTSVAYIYSTTVTVLVGYFPFQSVYFETSAVIITLILVGRLLESRTKERASSAIRKLLDLQPRTARIIRDGIESEIPIEQIQRGEILIIKPGERIPTDAIVIEGFSAVDESAITGEGIPVDKSTGNEIIGATINKSGLLKAKATKVGRDTVLSQIIALVEDARMGKAKIQKMVDQVAKYFVPAVILIAISVGLGWYIVGGIGFAYSLLAF